MNNSVCTKCNKPLPYGYKYKKCETCRNKEAQKIKDTLKAAGTIVGSILLFIVTKGKSSK